jgi:hypothetical protein
LNSELERKRRENVDLAKRVEKIEMEIKNKRENIK